ncbi:MAG: hypothetical protein ACRCTJ_05330, partial [Brevinema sp.]
MIHLIQQKLSEMIIAEFDIKQEDIYSHPLNNKEYCLVPAISIVTGEGKATSAWGNPQYWKDQKFQQKFLINQPINITFTDSHYESTSSFIDHFLSILPRYFDINGMMVELSPKSIKYLFSPGE